jgi:hypothetical protein
MKVVYLASPYTMGDVATNVRRQMVAFNELLTMGYCPIAPLFTHFQHIYYPRPYREWLKIGKELVRRSDIVLRLSGKSKGADAEVRLAKKHGIKVVYSLDQL